MHARRHQEVACTFRGGLGQDRRFDVLEALLVQVAAQGLYAANGFVQTGTGRYEDFVLLQYEKPLT